MILQMKKLFGFILLLALLSAEAATTSTKTTKTNKTKTTTTVCAKCSVVFVRGTIDAGRNQTTKKRSLFQSWWRKYSTNVHYCSTQPYQHFFLVIDSFIRSFICALFTTLKKINKQKEQILADRTKRAVHLEFAMTQVKKQLNDHNSGVKNFDERRLKSLNSRLHSYKGQIYEASRTLSPQVCSVAVWYGMVWCVVPPFFAHIIFFSSPAQSLFLTLTRSEWIARKEINELIKNEEGESGEEL